MSNWLYVKSCDMPLSCKTCSLEDFAEDGGSYCKINDDWTPPNGKRADCPLTPLPQKHGRLIEENDVLREIRRFKGYLDEDMIWRIEFAIKNRTKTIIEAED